MAYIVARNLGVFLTSLALLLITRVVCCYDGVCRVNAHLGVGLLLTSRRTSPLAAYSRTQTLISAPIHHRLATSPATHLLGAQARPQAVTSSATRHPLVSSNATNCDTNAFASIMSGPEYEKLLERLRQFQRSDLAHLHKTRLLCNLGPDDAPLNEQDFSWLGEVINKRTDARKSSATLLENILFAITSKPSAVMGAARDPHSKGQRRSGWWDWLERLENELREEKVRTYIPVTHVERVTNREQIFFGPHHEGNVQDHEER